MNKGFRILNKSKKSGARLGVLKTAHGDLKTPFFMPIATKAAVKHLNTEEIEKLNPKIILSNTYHLFLQPGMKVLEKVGGLHNLMDWRGAILTDSGGFQVFSLANLRKIKNNSVEFRSHLNGEKIILTPKKVLKIQQTIGSDIAMILDVCPSSKADKKELEEAVEITTRFAKQSKKAIKEIGFKGQVFAIVQGGLDKDLRLKSLRELKALNFDGYALGGLAVGESNEEMYQVLKEIGPKMPEEKPRYLMGVGTPTNLVRAVKEGMDMFDCVIPTREARHGRLYKFKKGFNFKNWDKPFWERVNIENAKFRYDLKPINEGSLKKYSLAYLHHLFKTNEPLAMRLATINNLEFYLELMERLRQAIKEGRL